MRAMTGAEDRVALELAKIPEVNCYLARLATLGGTTGSPCLLLPTRADGWRGSELSQFGDGYRGWEVEAFTTWQRLQSVRARAVAPDATITPTARTPSLAARVEIQLGHRSGTSIQMWRAGIKLATVRLTGHLRDPRAPTGTDPRCDSP